MSETAYLLDAIHLARENVMQGGRPFGAIIVKEGEVIATGVNGTAKSCDPTSHAELNAIRDASAYLKSADLSNCVVYTSGHPCPMCLGAIYMSGIRQVYYAYSNEDGEPFGLTSASVYEDMAKPEHLRAVKMHHIPAHPIGQIDLYAFWKEKAG